MLGYANRDVIHANRRLGYFPEPDGYGTGRPGPPRAAVEAVHGVGDGRRPPGHGRRPPARHPRRPRQAAPVRGRRAARPRPGRSAFRRPPVRGGPSCGVGRQPAYGRADHPRGQGRPPGLKASQNPSVCPVTGISAWIPPLTCAGLLNWQRVEVTRVIEVCSIRLPLDDLPAATARLLLLLSIVLVDAAPSASAGQLE